MIASCTTVYPHRNARPQRRCATHFWLWTFLLFLLQISALPAFAQWTVVHFGTGQLTNPFDVQIGKARNDGTNRVYISERNGRILEWSYQNGSWSKTTLVQAVSNLALLAIGDVHNDGTNRLYYTEFHKLGDLYEMTWTGTNWQRYAIDQDRSSLNLFIGAGRNDGYQRLYVGGVNTTSPVNVYTGLWEYTWATGTWQKVRIHSTPMEGRGVVGDLRTDGTLRILANGAGSAPSFFYDFTWNGATYLATAVDVANAALAPDPTAFGDTRNDGRMRVIANTQQGKREYVWNGSAWQAITFDTSVRRGDIRVARIKADGLYRIYSTHAGTAPKPPLTEFTWNPALSKYASNTVVDAVTGATAMMTAGNGRNDGVARLYAPNYAGGEMLEITSTNPFTYATPQSLLRLHGIIADARNRVVVSISNLTPKCTYRVLRTPALTQAWQSVDTFIAQESTTNWVEPRTFSSMFYHIIGSPQREP